MHTFYINVSIKKPTISQDNKRKKWNVIVQGVHFVGSYYISSSGMFLSSSSLLKELTLVAILLSWEGTLNEIRPNMQ